MNNGYYSVSAIKRLLTERGIVLTKERGQNFLIDKNTLEKIVEYAGITPEDTVLEIGPGIGSLTHVLIHHCKKLILVEFDKKLAELLIELSAGKEHVEVIHSDFLKTNIHELAGNEKLKICANIPYNLTSRIIAKIIEERKYVSSFTLTMQKEVAERVTAKPGNKIYGSLSVFCQTFTNPVICKIISPMVFYPVPKVESAVVRFEIPEKKYNIADEELFFHVVHSIFTSRRKTLKNSLVGSKFVALTKETVENALSACGFGDNVRGETLGIEELIRLTESLKRNGY